MQNSMFRCFAGAMLICLLSFGIHLSPLFAAEASPSDTPNKPAIAWHDYKEGLALAKAKNKKVFILFVTARCTYCKVMQAETLTNDQVIALLNEKFIPIKVDLGLQPELSTTYAVPGVPMSWFLESNGDKIGSRAGYLPPDQFMEMLRFIVSEKYKEQTGK